MSSNIIKKGTADEVRCAVTELRLSETFMDVPQLSVKVVSSTPITFEIGDYITYDYNGVTYTLRSIPEAAKNARPSTYGEAFVYNLVFYSPMWDLRNAPFLDLVLYDNGQHFTSMPDVTTYEDVYGIAARVQANMDNMYPGKWEIRVVSGLSADSTLAKRLSETQDFSLSDGKCLDALSQVYSQWGVSFVYSYESGKHVITIGGAETQEDTTGLFMYGRGNGLKVIKSSVQNASEIATRYYVYGGTQNMQPRYYNGRTMEPEYIHASDASNSTITGICSGRRLLGDNMYVPNLMVPVPKWGKSVWYVWTASSHSQAVFTEVRNPSIGDDYAFSEPNIGASRNVISSAASDSIVVNGSTYQYLTEVLYPDIRKAYIDAPQSYLDKYGIRPATLRFDGSGEREDIHPSIKGLTVGDIRAGLGSGAEYYPSTSVYTDPDERVDRVLSCDNPQDDGLTSSGANKYESSSSIAVAAVEKEFELALSNRAGNKIYTLGGRGSYYVLSEGAQFQVQYDGVLNARIPIQFSLATEGRDDRIHCRAGVKVNKTTSSGVESVIGSSIDEKAVVDLSTIDMDLGVDISGVSVQSGDTISVDIELYTLTTELHDKVTVNIEAFTARYNIAISLGTDFYVKLKQIGFDISEVPTNDGESPVISMTSGQCGGYEFEIHDVSYNASDDSWTLRCARVQDGTLGQWFPNSIFKIEPDDTFVLLNIALPEVYITANEQRLYDAALAERLYEERPLLEPEIDSKVMAESPQVLRAGMWFSVKDTDLGLAGADGGSYLILIDSVEVTDKPDTIRSFKVTLRNNKEDNVFVRMQRQIAQTSASVQSERRSQTKTSVPEVPTKGGGGGGLDETAMWSALGTEGSQQIDGSHITEALEDYVTLSTEQTVTGKKTFSGDVVLGGQRQDGSYGRAFVPSHAGPGVYDLYISNEPIAGEAPSGSGGIDETELWTILGNKGTQQIGASHLTTALFSYATQSWVENKGYLTSVDVSDIGGLGEGWAALLGSAPDFYTKSQVYSKSEADNRFVTLATEQIISGKKSFTALLTASAGISSTDADFSGYVSASKLYVPSYSGNKVYDLYISNAPVSGEVPSGSGGINEDELWSILSNGSGEKIIAVNHLPSLSSLTGDLPWSRVTNKPGLVNSVAGLTGSVTKAALQNALSDSTHRFVTDTQIESWNDKCDADDVKQIKVNNALNADNVPLSGVTGIGNGWDDLLRSDKPSTLAGYGITDAYTKDGVNSLLLGYVTLRSEQNITGKKTFTQLLTASAGISSTYANFSDYVSAAKLYLPYSGNNKKYDILISTAPVSGEAPSGTSGIDEDELWTILSNGSGEKVISVSFLPALASLEGNLDWSRIAGKPQWIGSSKPSYSYTEITGLGDQLATYARKDGSNATGTWGISISGDAATLGGVSKSGLLTSVTSTSTTNLSVVVGGKTISVTDLYAAYADRLLSDVSLWGQSFNGSQDVSGDMSDIGNIGMSGDITGAVNADFSGYVASEKLYLPYSGGNKVYDLCISTAPVSGSAPEAVNGIDEDELWDILGTPGTLTGQKIDASHLPPISDIGGKLDWGRITNPPSTYAPSAHEHPLSEISNLGSGWSDVLDGKLGGRWGSLLNYEVPGWLEQENLPVNGYLPVFGDKKYWIATDSHTHDIDEIGGLGTNWAAALTAAKPSWLTSVPKATDSAYGGFKTGYPEATGSRYYAVELNTLGQAYVHVPWTNTTYTLASFGITASAGEINKLDGVTATTDEINYLDGVTSSIQTQLNGKVPTSRTINGIALSSNITLTGASIKLTGYSEGSSTAVVAATDTINTAIAKLQNQIQTKAASSSLSSYLPKAGGTMTGDITMSGCSIRIPQSPSASSYDGILNADGSKAILAYYGENTYTGLMTGTHYLRSGASNLVHRRNGVDYAVLDTYNYTSTLDGRYMRIGSSGYPTAYRKVFNVNGTAWSFLGTTTDAPTIYAPTTAGTSGYMLQSTAGTPKWISRATLQHELFTAGAGCSSIPANADLNDYTTPGVYYCSYNATVSTWTNCPTENANSLTVLATAGVIQILREYGYSSSAKEFTRRYYNGTWTTWVQTPRMSDVYTRTDADSRYVNVSGDTMTGNLTVPRLVVQGTVTGNSTRYICSDVTDNIYMSVGGVIPLVARPECVRRSASAASVTLGTSTYPWADTYTKKLHITDTSSVAHLSFGRANAFNYISLPGASSTLAIAPGGDISGEGSALCISNSATYPGYSSGTRSLGTSSYRWSSVYSVAGNFSGAVTISSTLTLGAGITGVSTITGDGFTLGTNALNLYNSTSKANRITLNWNGSIARIYAIDEAGNNYRDLALGNTELGGNSLYYDASTARWGIGTTAPAYKLDVAGTLRATGRITAAGLTSSASITANAGITTTTLSASGAVTLSSTLTAAGLIKASAGVQIGSTSDYGWYITNSRIVAGQSTARGVNVGSLLVSSAWADYTKVPTNGIYCKGNIVVGGYISAPNSDSDFMGVMTETLEVYSWAQIEEASFSKLYIPSADGNNKYYIRIE